MSKKRLSGDVLAEASMRKSQLETFEEVLSLTAKAQTSVKALETMWKAVDTIRRETFDKYFEANPEEDSFEDRIFGYSLDCLVRTTAVIRNCINELKLNEFSAEENEVRAEFTQQVNTILKEIKQAIGM